MVALCPLDAEYPIEVDVADSPLFAGLLTHWKGISETVTELQGHLYQEVISLTQVQVVRHVFPPVPNLPRFTPSVELEETGPIAIVAEEIKYTRTVLELDSKPMNVQMEAMRAYNQDDIDATITTIERYHFEEDNRRPKWYRTRLFFKLLWNSYKEARSA